MSLAIRIVETIKLLYIKLQEFVVDLSKLQFYEYGH